MAIESTTAQPQPSTVDTRERFLLGEMLKIKITDVNFIGSLFVI